MFNYKFTIIVLISLLFSCKEANNEPLRIQFSPDSTAILISNIEAANLLQLKNNILTDSTYQSLVTVLETPGDLDSTGIERERYGKLTLKENQLVFTPDSPFLKGKNYLIETLVNVSFGNVEQLVKGKATKSLSAQQQVLER